MSYFTIPSPGASRAPVVLVTSVELSARGLCSTSLSLVCGAGGVCDVRGGLFVRSDNACSLIKRLRAGRLCTAACNYSSSVPKYTIESGLTCCSGVSEVNRLEHRRVAFEWMCLLSAVAGYLQLDEHVGALHSSSCAGGPATSYASLTARPTLASMHLRTRRHMKALWPFSAPARALISSLSAYAHTRAG